MGSSDVNLQQREQLPLGILKQTSNDARTAADLQIEGSIGNGSVSDNATNRELGFRLRQQDTQLTDSLSSGTAPSTIAEPHASIR
jgi:hypothetical protein